MFEAQHGFLFWNCIVQVFILFFSHVLVFRIYYFSRRFFFILYLFLHLSLEF
jgi:hypothetical protein